MRKWLIELRNKKGLTQSEAAEKLHISQGYYSQIENGDRQKAMTAVLVKSIADLFGMTCDEIIKYDTESEDV